MNKLTLLLALAVLVVVTFSNASAQMVHYSNAYNKWQAGKRGYGDPDIFRLKRGYHFFRLRRGEQCIIPAEAQIIVENQMENGVSPCTTDFEFLKTTLAKLSEAKHK